MTTIQEHQQWVKDAWTQSCKRVSEADELLFLMEEIGEMAEAIRKLNGKKENKNIEVDLKKEFGDILLSLFTLSIRYGVDLETAFERTKQSVIERYVQRGKILGVGVK